MRIQITAGGIYGSQGEIPVGTKLEVSSVPDGWAGRYVDLDKQGDEPVADGTDALKARVTELEGIVAERDKEIADFKAKLPKPSLKAEHHGGGKFNVTEGETLHLSGLSKADADAFNAMSDEDKAAFVKAEKDKA
jgi:hypothetical protein